MRVLATTLAIIGIGLFVLGIVDQTQKGGSVWWILGCVFLFAGFFADKAAKRNPWIDKQMEKEGRFQAEVQQGVNV